MSENSNISRWIIEQETVNFSSRVWDLRTRRYYHPGKGISDDFYYIASPDWAVVVGRTLDQKILFVRQFRWGIDDFSLELPGGIIDPNEEAAAAGIREFTEETGYEGRSCQSLGACLPNPSMLNNCCHFLFIDGAEPSASGSNWDSHEEIEVVAIDQAEVQDWVKEGKLMHSLTLAALYRFNLIVDLS